MQAEVRSLIEREMAAMDPRDYLAHLPPPPVLFQNNPILAAEVQKCSVFLLEAFHVTNLCLNMQVERMGRGERMPPLDVSRYEVTAPSKELSRDVEAWRASLANAQTQLEHQHNRLANLELLDR